MKKHSIAPLSPYSVTMSVYDKENPQFLKESIDSIINQTHKTNDFIIICDGELTDELYEILDNASCAHSDILRVIKLREHVGTAKAANLAIKLCKNELVGKMDSDDIALPDRFEIQIRRMMLHPELDIIGSYIEEFDSDTGKAIAVRKTPLSSKAVLEFARQRAPFNNQTMLFKRSVALACGGYDGTLQRCEDYDFMVRMLSNGAVGGNIAKVLVRYRVTKDNLQRRRNFRNTKAFFAVRWKIYRSGFSSFADFLVPCAMQLALFALPSQVTGLIYKKFMR